MGCCAVIGWTEAQGQMGDFSAVLLSSSFLSFPPSFCPSSSFSSLIFIFLFCLHHHFLFSSSSSTLSFSRFPPFLTSFLHPLFSPSSPPLCFSSSSLPVVPLLFLFLFLSLPLSVLLLRLLFLFPVLRKVQSDVHIVLIHRMNR